jgi:hypothetical protein
MEDRNANPTPWEVPTVKSIIDMFGGTVSKITPLNEVQIQVGGNDDGFQIQR